MSWGETYIEQKAEFVSGRSEVGGPCDSAVVTVIKDGNVPQVCLRGNNIEIFVEAGSQKIDGIKARVLGSDNVFIAENILTQKLDPLGSVKAVITPSNIGQMKQIKLTPVIQSGEQKQFCTQSETLIEEPFRLC
jgi:hypothetical protein